MRIRVNPTRMQLLKLRSRLELARRGHKLLKDKLDGLVQRFFTIKKDYLSLHEDLEVKMVSLFSSSLFAYALSSPNAFEVEEKLKPTITLQTTIRNIMGVKIPDYSFSVEGKPLFKGLSASVEAKEASDLFISLLPELVRMAALSKSLRLLAEQIIETRRRVNALEYILIPELQRNVNLIKMKLSELERSSKVVLLKMERVKPASS
ncbi:MAG: V-type ATP synthase subunit D [bacterium]